MPRLLIQCQGSPGPLSFKVGKLTAGNILRHYYSNSERVVYSIMGADDYCYYIDLSLVSWICVIDESKPKPKLEPNPPEI